jgi:hypothetical protein
MLCLVKAVVWTFISGMPPAGAGWISAAAACIWLQKRSRGK